MMKEMRKNSVTLDLLEFLTYQSGCDFLSDLHDPENSSFVYKAIYRIEPEQFSLKEWNEAARYITGRNVAFCSRREAYRFLLKNGNSSGSKV
ncbi:hypothetical protein [Hydrogeniiclostridium mannosilyticum]|uniref:hypothetical protein n=1 Tax=Hydrogeniiclostridium mannosilyticum TaxID=2764322 RepID=UPI00399AF749